MAEFFSAGASTVFEKMAEADDDAECKEGEDVLCRSDRFANAAAVFSRAIAAIENRLCLERLEEADLAVSRECDDCGRAVEDIVVEAVDEADVAGGISGVTISSLGRWLGSVCGNEVSFGRG